MVVVRYRNKGLLVGLAVGWHGLIMLHVITSDALIK
jgi:hypothetical protein